MIRDEVLTAEEVEGKSNTELLSKHILELQKDKGNLIDRCRELEQQNNWLEGCKSELGEHLGKANDRIAVLEKRCANYEMTFSKIEKGTCDICKETEKDKKIADLEKENAELKERLKEHESVGNAQFWENVWSWKTKAEQLTKAKELLKRFIELENCTLDYDDIKEAEQFLKETE